MPFNNPIGLYALFFLVPFILIYLIRPKSFEKIVPSLMFILKEKQKSRKASFLQKLLRNLLLIIQLFAIVVLAFSVAAPYIEIPHKVMIKNSIIIIDASASMQTKEGSTTRFQKAIEKAKDNLGIRNTIILAENVPLVVLESGSSGEANSIINKLTPKATTTNLGDAILLANDLLENKKGVVTVISDFIQTEGSDLLTAKKTLEAKGNVVKFIKIREKANNIGITNLIISKDETVVEIKNYEENDKEVNAILSQNNKKIASRKVKILKDSKEKITFKTPNRLSKIRLDTKDDLELDNTAYISSPTKKTIKILLITNYPDGSPIRAALESMPEVDLEIREPPAINAYNINHDIIIISDITKKLFVPTDMMDIKKYAKHGGKLIIVAQEDIAQIDWLGMLPLNIIELSNKPTTMCVDLIGSVFPRDPFSEEPCFATINKYIKGKAWNNTVTMLSAESDNSPLLTEMKLGTGKIIYNGIIDKYSSFYSTPLYPIFWYNLIGYLTDRKDIKEYNQKTGKTLIINEQNIRTPEGMIKTDKLLLDNVGFYEFNHKKIAVNLLSEKESNVNQGDIKIESELKNIQIEKGKDTETFYLDNTLLVIGIIILLIEFFYIKSRGDL